MLCSSVSNNLFDLGKRLPEKYRKFIWILISTLGLKSLYWRLNNNRSELYKELGFKNSKYLFKLGSNFHKELMGEPEYKVRRDLYARYYQTVYEFLNTHLPDTKTFGFNSDLINEYIHLFRDYGCGTGVSTRLLAGSARFVSGVDASSVAVKSAEEKSVSIKNIEFKLISDCYLPFEDDSIDAVYSNDLLEHLHPADANTHLEEVRRVLKVGGYYLFWTPGSSTGPHDCTQCFYPRFVGIKSKADHIKEYTFAELISMLQAVGYKKVELPGLKRDVLMIATK
jgi:SAM-dependent methyltransferase